MLAYIEKLRSEPPPPINVPMPPAHENLPPQDTLQTPIATSEHCKIYSVWTNSESLLQKDFYEISTREKIREQMFHIIREEGPIYESLLKKRIVKAWGFTRAGENIQAVLNACLPSTMTTSCIGDNRVFWPYKLSPKSYLDYRIAPDEMSRRSIEEIPPEELANAMCDILIDFTSCQQDTLYRETVKLFGFSALTAKMRHYLDFGMKALQQSGRI